VIVPDSTILLDYMLNKMADIVDRLVVCPERMKENLERTKGVIFSQRVMLELINRGLTRKEAYDVVQQAALTYRLKICRSWTPSAKNPRGQGGNDQRRVLACEDLGYHVKHVGHIFKKAGI
jgi:adenylosuccinate lyase